MIDELLVSFLRSDSSISDLADEIAVGETPTDNDGHPLVDTYIWISTYDEDDQLDLDGLSGLTYYRFDLEVCSVDDRVAKRLARLVKKKLQGHGAPDPFGEITTADDTTIVGVADAVFVESKDEDYVAVNQFTSEDLTIVAFDIMIAADDAQDDYEGA